MRYLFAVMADRRATVEASADEAAAIDAFNDRLEVGGHRLVAIGIAGPDEAVVFDNRAGVGLVSPGPLVDADQFMAGLWIIEAADDATAHALAAEASRACNRCIEVRPIFG